MKKTIFILFTILICATNVLAQDAPQEETAEQTEGAENYTIFDDRQLLKNYTEKYRDLSEEILLAMIKDDNLTSYKAAAALTLYKQLYCHALVGYEKKLVEKIMLRRLNRTDSAFVQVEIMHILTIMDRYRYFGSMVPALIQKLDHYNATVNEMAYHNLKNLLEEGSNRTREARIVFNTLRKILFLSRRRLASVTEPDLKLQQKIDLLRWSVKVLGNQELQHLPKEVINLL